MHASNSATAAAEEEEPSDDRVDPDQVADVVSTVAPLPPDPPPLLPPRLDARVAFSTLPVPCPPPSEVDEGAGEADEAAGVAAAGMRMRPCGGDSLLLLPLAAELLLLLPLLLVLSGTAATSGGLEAEAVGAEILLLLPPVASMFLREGLRECAATTCPPVADAAAAVATVAVIGTEGVRGLCRPLSERMKLPCGVTFVLVPAVPSLIGPGESRTPLAAAMHASGSTCVLYWHAMSQGVRPKALRRPLSSSEPAGLWSRMTAMDALTDR